jgi:hypothetical protein
VKGLAAYLSLSVDSVRDLDQRGLLRRVRLPGANGADLNVVLYDRLDVDALIERMKEPARP